MRKKYRGVKPATLVTVLEGKGTEEDPYQEVNYVITTEQICGLTRQVTLGKVVALEEPLSTLTDKD